MIEDKNYYSYLKSLLKNTHIQNLKELNKRKKEKLSIKAWWLYLFHTLSLCSLEMHWIIGFHIDLISRILSEIPTPGKLSTQNLINVRYKL